MLKTCMIVNHGSLFEGLNDIHDTNFKACYVMTSFSYLITEEM